jgi:hypothetical protein
MSEKDRRDRPGVAIPQPPDPSVSATLPPVPVQAIEVRHAQDIPLEFGDPLTLEPMHPVKFVDVPPEGYDYYGRKGAAGVDKIAMRWVGGDEFKMASPVKIDEIEATYKPLSASEARELGLSNIKDVYQKTAPSTVYRVPSGYAVTVHTREQSTETIEGGGSFGIAIDTEGCPYKFDLGKNLSSQKDLPPAYREKS